MDLQKAIDFIWENARLLERAVFEYRFYNGSAARVIDIIRTYQNADGGFGHALEPDVRAPDSHPLFVEFALGKLYDCGLRDADIAYKACDFLSHHADLQLGIPTLFPTYLRFSRAGHWNSPAASERSLDRLIGLVGLANWQGIQHPWLVQAVEVCLEKIKTTPFDDAHTIGTAFRLLEGVSKERNIEPLFQKLTNELRASRFYIAEAPVMSYGLTPLEFAPSPDAYCRPLFSQAQIDGHLADLESKQEKDGGWPILWGPPPGAATSEWRAIKTVTVLTVSKAYGRL
jgi:hypothetical protein